MFIDVRIPWEPERKLGYAFNRMMKSVEGWVLVLDWDVMLLSINWYDICINAIEKVGRYAGLISCLTNKIGCPLQKYKECPPNDDIELHSICAKSLEIQNKGNMIDVTDRPWKLSGMFFLTNKDVYDKIGPVPDDKFIGMDNWYHDRVKEAGFRIYIMTDLYVYHGYKRLWK